MDKSTAIRKIYTNVVTINDETCTDKDGNVVAIDESLVNAKIAENEYKENRRAEYPDLSEQLDKLYHDMTNNKLDTTGEWHKAVKAVKDKYPKP
tara:strand:+ start:22 stop:303 length:282 start_codon:yes stop_codon:yes gene_type:complete